MIILNFYEFAIELLSLMVVNLQRWKSILFMYMFYVLIKLRKLLKILYLKKLWF